MVIVSATSLLLCKMYGTSLWHKDIILGFATLIYNWTSSKQSVDFPVVEPPTGSPIKRQENEQDIFKCTTGDWSCYVECESSCFAGDCDASTVEPWGDENDMLNQMLNEIAANGEDNGYLEITTRRQTGSGEAGGNFRFYGRKY